MRDTTESRLVQTCCKYKNCAKINSGLSTMHLTFSSPERFFRCFQRILRLQLLGASPPRPLNRALPPASPLGAQPPGPLCGVHTPGGAPFHQFLDPPLFNLHIKVIIVSQDIKWYRVPGGGCRMGSWSSRTHANSYPSHLVPIPTHTQ